MGLTQVGANQIVFELQHAAGHAVQQAPQQPPLLRLHHLVIKGVEAAQQPQVVQIERGEPVLEGLPFALGNGFPQQWLLVQKLFQDQVGGVPEALVALGGEGGRGRPEPQGSGWGAAGGALSLRGAGGGQQEAP